MTKEYDPKLREAMSEIEATLKKYDIGGFFHIESKTHCEFKFFITHPIPSWSNIKWLKEGKAVHIKLYSKTDRENTDATLGLIYNIRDTCARTFLQCEEMKRKIKSLDHVNIHHAPGPINNDDRDFE